jgi:hypothetical protein
VKSQGREGFQASDFFWSSGRLIASPGSTARRSESTRNLLDGTPVDPAFLDETPNVSFYPMGPLRRHSSPTVTYVPERVLITDLHRLQCHGRGWPYWAKVLSREYFGHKAGVFPGERFCPTSNTTSNIEAGRTRLAP